MNHHPLVSIVIPTYNQRESFLRECIESAMRQTYQNIEIVISDNHSTNNVPDIIAEYAATDNRIRTVVPDRFLNIPENLLFVFSQAKGAYSCYISSDDILLPQCVEVLLQNMEAHPGTVFAHGEAIYFKSDNSTRVLWKYFNEVSGVYELNEEVARRLFDFTYVCFAGCLIKQSVWSSITALIEKEKLHVQYSLDILLIVLFFQQGKLYFHNEVLAKVREENETRRSRLPHLIKDAATIWDFWEKDAAVMEQYKPYQLQMQQSKKRQFIEFYRALFYDYSLGIVDFTSFKNTLVTLRSFNIATPLQFTIFTRLILLFPGLSIKLYKLIKR